MSHPADRTRGLRLTTGLATVLLTAMSILDAEPKIVIESLGVVERQARLRGYTLSFGTEQYPPRLLMGFADGDGTWIVNLQDGSSRQAKAPGFEKEHLFWPTFIGADGKVFGACHRGALTVYDPRADTIKMLRPIPKAYWLRGMAIGPDGAVYVSDYPTGSAARYDPMTGKVTNYGLQGGPFNLTHIYGYSVGCDGRYVYTAAGKMPWYVVALDTESGKQKNLLQFESTDHPEVHQRGDEVFLEVKIGKPKDGKEFLRYRLADGRTAVVDEIPDYDSSHVPGIDAPKPEWEPFGRNLSVAEGGAAFRYRPPGQKEWEVITVPVSGVDLKVARLAPIPDGKLVLATGPYGNAHTYDPKTGSYALLGDPASKNVYDLLSMDGTVYFCGYPNSILGVMEKDGGRLLGNWHDVLGCKHAMFLVRGADGRIYSGNHAEREFVGGALGWFDPGTAKFGGFRFPNDDCEWLTSALDGTLIIYASDFSHDPMRPEIKGRDGKLIVFDTKKQKVVRQFSPVSGGSAGIAVEAEPGVLVGFGLHEKRPVAYKADVVRGKLLQRVPLPGEAARVDAKLGPDGKVYAFLGGKLVRVDAGSLEVEPVVEATPGRMAFIGDDLYLAGETQLRRIRNVVAVKSD